MYSNVDNSLLSKINEISLRIYKLNPDFVLLTEIKPKYGQIPDKEVLQLNGYDLFLNNAYDDNDNRGTAIYTKSSLEAVQVINEDTNLFKDSVWVCVRGSNGKQLLLGNIYRSGTPEKAKRLDENLHKAMRKMCTNPAYNNIILTGDFNHGDIKWDTTNSLIHTSNSYDEKFKECLNDCLLNQLVNKATRMRGKEESLLDLILVNNEDLVSEIQYDSHFGDSDHITLNFKINSDLLDINRQFLKKTVLKYYSTDIEAMKKLLNIDWDTEFQGKSAEESYTTFLLYYNEAVKKCVPSIKYDTNMKPVKPDWMTYSTESLVTQKHHAWIRYMNTKNEEDYQSYKNVRNQVTHAIKKDRKEFELKIAQEVKDNVKAFWNYVNQKKRNRSKIPDLMKNDGTRTVGDKEKADALNDQFSSVFTHETDNIPEFQQKILKKVLSNIDITENMVKKKLKDLRVDKSPGPDNVHPFILKNLSCLLAKPLQIIYQQSLKTRSLPVIWKEGIVTPLYKKDSKILPENYRPVSLTSIVCKTQESIIVDHIMDHILLNNLRDINQHGFTPKRSTVTNLSQALNIWIDALAHGFPVDIIYFDFAKAFDRVPHKRLVAKVQSFGITGDVLGWIEDFLKDRHQKVIVNGTYSDSAPVTSGVPQGSVLGPVLFLIYVSDMPEMVQNFISLFADDTKLFTSIIDHQSTISLQNDINHLAQWSDKMLMKFNLEKCHVMHLGANNPKHDYTLPSMEFHEQKGDSEAYFYLFPQLDKVNQEKDLGVIVDDKLSFEFHIDKKVAKAKKMTGIVRHTIKYLTPVVFTLLFKSIIRPHVEYASMIWSPITKKLQDKLERVQRRATKMVLGLSELSYSDRLRKLNLPTLQYRRLRSSLIFLYKYTEGLVDTDLNTGCSLCLNSNSLQPTLSQNTRGHNKRFQIQHHQGIKNKFFTAHTLPVWNKLNSETVNAASLEIFKNRLASDQNMPSMFEYAFTY